MRLTTGSPRARTAAHRASPSSQGPLEGRPPPRTHARGAPCVAHRAEQATGRVGAVLDHEGTRRPGGTTHAFEHLVCRFPPVGGEQETLGGVGDRLEHGGMAHGLARGRIHHVASSRTVRDARAHGQNPEGSHVVYRPMVAGV